MEYEEYGRSSLDNYSTGELQAEIDRRKAEESNRKMVENAIVDISKNIDKTTVIKKAEYLHANYYEIEVRNL